MIDSNFIDINSDKFNIQTKFILKLIHNEQFELLDNYLKNNKININDINFNTDYEDRNLFQFVDNSKSVEYLLQKGVIPNNIGGALFKYPETLSTLLSSPIFDQNKQNALAQKINNLNDGSFMSNYLYSDEYSKENFKKLVDMGISLENISFDDSYHILGKAIMGITTLEIDAKKNNGLSGFYQNELHKLNTLVKDVCEFKIDKSFVNFNRAQKENQYLYSNDSITKKIIGDIRKIEPIHNNYSFKHLKDSLKSNDLDKIKENLDAAKKNGVDINSIAADLLNGMESMKSIKYLIDNTNLDLKILDKTNNINIPKYFSNFKENIHLGINKNETIDGFNKLIDDLSNSSLINAFSVKAQIRDDEKKLIQSLTEKIVEQYKQDNKEKIYKQVDKNYVKEEANIKVILEERLNEKIKRELNIDLKNEKDPTLIKYCNDLKNEYRDAQEAEIYEDINERKNEEIEIILYGQENQEKLSSKIEKLNNLSVRELKDINNKLDGKELTHKTKEYHIER